MTEMTDITETQLKQFEPLILAIKNCKTNHNWPRGDYDYRPDLGEKSVEEIYHEFSPELIDEFSEYIPTFEGNVHTINEITVLTISEEQRLL
jgi:hypothetical protein